MVIEMVFLNVFWLNAWPNKTGVSTKLSPSTIVTGRKVDCKLHCQIEFGQYVQTHEEHDNSMNARTVGALALRPTGNRQGGHYLYSLYSGRRLHRTHWTKLPMPAEVQARLSTFVKRGNAHKGLLFNNGADQNYDDLPPLDDEYSDSEHYR